MQGKRNAAASSILSNSLGQGPCLLRTNGMWNPVRVARGTYTAPVASRFGARAPAPEKVVQALAEQSGETVVPHGASAANTLGQPQPGKQMDASGASSSTRLDNASRAARDPGGPGAQMKMPNARAGHRILGGLGRNRKFAGEPLFKPISIVTKKSGYG
ncbi:hypothetical protein [Bordetella bronchiseptica]|uniref:hypothetical protein n=1 Tax=Bordetella bronchiseptica TaxID=518 RepID=UPI001249B144|nr:hypothetical protein [Bordetella bronchiseptica]